MATVQFTLYAQRLLGTGKTSEAITVLEEGLKEYPEYATAYALLARAYLQLHDVPTAYEVTANAIQRFPYHRGLALLHQQLNEILHSLISSGSTASSSSGGTPTDTASTHHESTPPPPALPEDSLPTLDQGHITDTSAQGSHEESATDIPSTLPPEAQQLSPMQNVPITTPSDEGQLFDEGITSLADTADTITEAARRTDLPDTPTHAPPSPSTAFVSSEASHFTMRLVETASIDRRAMRMLRSSNIRLIPGLEFAPLRIESTRVKDAVHTLEFPPFRPIRGSQETSTRPRHAIPATPAALEAELRSRAPQQSEMSTTKTSLELLAEQLERARIKSPDASVSTAPDPTLEAEEPTVVTETIAAIYERQGAIEQAIKAYTILARLNPDRRSYFEEKIAQLRMR